MELEELGFDALWVPGGPNDRRPLLGVVGELLDATGRATVATGILSIWVRPPHRHRRRRRRAAP